MDMNLVKTLLVSILIVLIFVSIISFQLILSFAQTFLEPSFYEKIGDEQEFYAQIRQLIFRLVNRSLPHGREGMPYIEKALTENWLEEELNQFIGEFFGFAKGYRDEPPIIPIHKLKEKVAQSIEDDRTLDEKQKLAYFWFEPLPDKVRLQDFISAQLISGVRENVIAIKQLFWILLGLVLILSGLVFAVVRDWKTAILCIATASMASGIQSIFLALKVEWLFKHSSYIIELYKSIAAFEIPEESVWGLLYAFKNGFTEHFILTGSIIAIISGIVIYFIPIKERSLTLVK